jgi:hypothetical protein
MIPLLQSHSNKIPTLFENDSSVVKQYLIDNVDWNLVFSVMISLRRKYNTGAETFVKSDIVSESIEQASNNKLKYINEVGCDFYIPELDVRIEMKSSNSNIFPRTHKRYTTSLKLKNFRSVKSVSIDSMEKTFDYLLMLEPLKCGIVSYEKIVPHLEIFSDGIGAKVDVYDIEFVKEVSKVTTTDILLFDRYEQMKKQIIQDVKENLYYEPV